MSKQNRVKTGRKCHIHPKQNIYIHERCGKELCLKCDPYHTCCAKSGWVDPPNKKEVWRK